ncbi:MAG TPA: glycosyltransferase, partial [Candidatus Saccharimonadales bacterium]|nr:glycosyltransferase [Candidatus Saccharimonadales bacterium]
VEPIAVVVKCDGGAPIAPGTSLDGITLHGVGRPGRFYGEDGKRTVGEALSFTARLLPDMVREHYDVIDISATPYLPVYAAWLATRLTRTPLVVTWHEVWGEYWQSYLAHRPSVAGTARRLEAGCARLGDAAVSVSPFTARRLAELHPGAPAARVVSNGISGLQIQATPAATDSSDVVFAGRLIDDKQVHLLLESVALLSDRFPDLRACVVGDGPQRGELEALAARIGIADRVRFTGRVGEATLIGHLKASKVLAFPSVREGFGMTVLEAQACGAVPVVVASPHSAAVDLVRDGVDGIVCASSVASLAAALASLLADDGLRTRMRAAAQQAAGARDWDTIAVQMEAIYGEVVERRSMAGRQVEARP